LFELLSGDLTGYYIIVENQYRLRFSAQSEKITYSTDISKAFEAMPVLAFQILVFIFGKTC